MDSMNTRSEGEPIPVKEAIEAVKMALEVCEKATFAPWRNIGYGVVRGGPFQQYTNGMAEDQIASITFPNREGAQEIRDENAAFIVAARAGYAATLKYLLDRVIELQRDGKLGNYITVDYAQHLHAAVLPIVQWAREQKKGGTKC